MKKLKFLILGILFIPSFAGATVYTGTSTVTFSLSSAQDVIVWAKGTADNIGVTTPQNVVLKLDTVTVDSINAGAGGVSTTGKFPYSLIHSDNLSSGSHTYVQSGNAGINDLVMVVEVLDYSTSGGGATSTPVLSTTTALAIEDMSDAFILYSGVFMMLAMFFFMAIYFKNR